MTTTALIRLRRVWPVFALAAWTVLWFALLASGKRNRPAGGAMAWRPFLVTGSRLLFSGQFGAYHASGGLHIYANYPGLQIGPLAFVVTAPIRYLGPNSGLVAAQLVMSAMGLAALLIIKRIADTARPELASVRAMRWTLLIGGAIFIIAWQEVAVAYGHLDDCLVLVLTLLATWAAIRGRPVVTGILLGLAADAKPWALVFLPVLLLAGGLARWRAPNLAGRPVWLSLRPMLVAATMTVAITMAGWLPFYLADSGTSAAFHYKIANLPDSALHALGVLSTHTPAWDRPAQITIGCVLGALVVWRGRWPALILLGVGARIAIDPAAHSYYTAGVVAGALVWDLVGWRRPVPVWTVLSYAALNLVPLLTHDNPARGDFRLYLVLAFTVIILACPASWCWQPARPERDVYLRPGRDVATQTRALVRGR